MRGLLRGRGLPLLVAVLVCQVANWLWPVSWWLAFARGVTIGLVVFAAWDFRGPLLYAFRCLRYWPQMHRPLILNEDDEIHNLWILPGEHLHVGMFPDGAKHVHVHRPGGTVRVSKTWPPRH